MKIPGTDEFVIFRTDEHECDGLRIVNLMLSEKAIAALLTGRFIPIVLNGAEIIILGHADKGDLPH